MNLLVKLTFRVAVLSLGVSLGNVAVAENVSVADDHLSSSAQEPGVWQKHVYTFRFLGFTSTYSCDGLADRLRVLLIAAGARSDSKSRAGVCANGYGLPDTLPEADLTFYTLTPVGSAVDTDGPRMIGVWRPVAIASRKPRELAVGDCELVEQFRALVLPMFTVRNMDDHTTCVPHQQSGSVINLKFESLTDAGRAPDAKSATAK